MISLIVQNVSFPYKNTGSISEPVPGKILAATVVIVVSAKTGNQKNPNQPITAIVSTTAVSAEDTVSAAVATAVTAEKKNDDPKEISTHHSARTGI